MPHTDRRSTNKRLERLIIGEQLIQRWRFENQRAKVNGNTLELQLGDSEHAVRFKKQ